MGNSIGCIVQKYGPQLATLISLEKVQAFLGEQTAEVKKVVNQNKDQIASKFQGNLKGQKQRVNNIFEKTKKDVGEEKLQKFASLQKKSVDEVLNTKEIDNQFGDVEKNFNSEFSGKINGILKQIDQKEKQFKDKIKDQKPHVPIYSQLPRGKRQQVVRAIQDKYGPEMKQRQQKYTATIKQIFNPESFKAMLSGLDPSEKLKNIGDSAEGVAKTVKLTANGPKGLSCFK